MNIDFENVEKLCHLLHIELSSHQIKAMILLKRYLSVPNLVRLMNDYPDLRTDEEIFRSIVSCCKKQIYKIYGTFTDEQNHIINDIEHKKLKEKQKREHKKLEKLDRIKSWCKGQIYYGMSSVDLHDCECKY